ncbi:hypothetical protein [Pseudomonas sp.]|uniref:hypothetical protein n=1 Tax=Pseudomonas sp. TaxID=306 RepID=UPI0032650BED
MSIPANALSDEECLHYAALDPAAAAELTRRLTAQSIGPGAECEGLREDIRMLESQADDAEDEANLLRTYMAEALEFIRRAMSPDEKKISVNELLQKALERLE